MPNNTQLSKDDAQKRIDQIEAFYHEINTLEKDRVFALPFDEQEAIKQYHQHVRQSLVQQFDVDINQGSKNLSLGMQVASFIGALALATSVFFLFYQFWGYFSTTLQVIILILSPLLTLLLTVMIRRHEQTGYFAKLMALTSFSCFVLNLSMLGAIFNITPSDNALAVWCAYVILLAYAFNVRLLLIIGIAFFYGFIVARINAWNDIYWLSLFDYPESFLLPALFVFLVPSLFSHRAFSGFDNVYRITGMTGVLTTLFILSVIGTSSYLSWTPEAIEHFYQVAGFTASACFIVLGIKKTWPVVVNTGNVFFVAFLYLKFFDWWWEIMPHYLFFFIIGLTAVLFMVIFNRLRGQLKNASTDGVEV